MKGKNVLGVVVGIITSVANWCFGGYTIPMELLLICMCLDYLCGLVVAGVFKKSKKSEHGKLSSKEGWKGLARKVLTLSLLIVANRLDLLFGKNYIQETLTIAFIVNELLSILENATLMGLTIPKVLTDALEVLNKKINSKDK